MYNNKIIQNKLKKIIDTLYEIYCLGDFRDKEYNVYISSYLITDTTEYNKCIEELEDLLELYE